MEYRNCLRCGKVFNYMSQPICDDCARAEEEDFMRVKEYVWDNPHSNLIAISEATGVSEKRIMKYLKEGRLEIENDESAPLLTCDHCGKPITSGRYCDACVININSTINDLFVDRTPEIKKPISNGNPKMHTYGNEKKRY